MNLKKIFSSGNLITILIIIGIIASTGILISKSVRKDKTADGRIIVNYWEKVSGFEFEAVKKIVDDFNRSQNKIYVKILSVSDIRRKLMLAVSGGNPPDLSGMFSDSVPNFALKGALLPLNKLMDEYHINRDDYVPIFWKMADRNGFTWALPLSLNGLALHWNKEMFRNSGLDPDRPPRTIEELDEYCEKLTTVKIMRNGEKNIISYSKLTAVEKKNKDYEIVQLGFSPSNPGWWNPYWGYWFYASLWNGENKITAACKENIESLKWYAGFTKKYGVENMRRFLGSLGNFASPQDPFISGKIAMTLQGVWMSNFVSKFNPSLEWGVAAFPSVRYIPGKPVTFINYDALIIPNGSLHPKEAFEYIKYVSTQKVNEKYNILMNNIPPFKKVSPGFLKKHPNTNIKEYVKLTSSPNARYSPDIQVIEEYKDLMNAAYEQAFNDIKSPEEALKYVQKEMQPKLDKALWRWNKVKDSRIEEWRRENDAL